MGEVEQIYGTEWMNEVEWWRVSMNERSQMHGRLCKGGWKLREDEQDQTCKGADLHRNEGQSLRQHEGMAEHSQ